MPYRIAGIDVHKKMLAVVVADVEVEGEYQFERRRFGSNPEHLRLLSEWLLEQQVEEIVMESTAQYWKPVWGALERYWKPICQKREGAGQMSGALHLAQAQSNRGPRGRKRDYAEVGAKAATFSSAKKLSSWVGACPGDEESAGVNSSHRSPKGNRHMRRILNQAANAAVMHKGSIFAIVYCRLVPRLGHNQAIGAIGHRLCQLIWMILHQGVRYEEHGPAVTRRSKQRRTAKMIRELRLLGYRIEPVSVQSSNPA